MTTRRIFLTATLVFFLVCGWLAWWTLGWLELRPLEPRGGLWFPGRVEIAGPLFRQGDPRWGAQKLGPTEGTLSAEGCAVASAAMALASHGVDTDPGRLNQFLTRIPGGYTPQGWIYWEKAAEVDPQLTDRLLPHYEDKPSYFLIDTNLARGNPVIARIRHPSGGTHFVLLCGKEGFEYLMRDPGGSEQDGATKFSTFGLPIEAIRFYAGKRSGG